MSNGQVARKCLECQIGLEHVLLAADVVDVLGEYVVATRLPLSDRVEFSIGVWSERPVLSISVVQHDPAPSRSTRGVLLITEGPGLRWVFEIDAATGFVEADQLAAGSAPTPWRGSARLADGRTIPYIDVAALDRELAVPAPAGPARQVMHTRQISLPEEPPWR